MTEWKKVKSPQYPNGKLCKEMSQESKELLRAYEIGQRIRYNSLYIERVMDKASPYTETVPQFTHSLDVTAGSQISIRVV